MADSSPFSMQLFLGIPVDQRLAKKLSMVDPALCSVYIHDSDLYLQEVDHLAEKFLGKRISGSIDLPNLELLRKNILSLFEKLLPDHPVHDQQLVLFAVPGEK